MSATPSPSPAKSRAPLQGRSKASLERMLATARDLMLERGNEDFTLQEVSKRGKVSIGSIYLRFSSKDSLVMAVLEQTMQQLAADETAMIERLKTDCQDLPDFVTSYVEDYAEILRLHAPLLRLTMLRAEHDVEISTMGKQAAARAVRQAVEAFLAFGEEIRTPDPALSAASAHHIIFATLARQLSLGSTGESIANYDWAVLKRELTRMCIAYLISA
ncbi:TetR/AcrR family transcriptional regulator [Novosphingobium umbonatum]|nr:TetR/AcrR family transcriptional regulator [Novosphingobium umbonatum]